VLDSLNHLHLHEVIVGDTDGKVIDILRGVHAGERVALNVGERIADGALVRVQAHDSTAAAR
jgi:hypothetical protein